MAFCDNCGSELNESAKFCSSCGKPVHHAETIASNNQLANSETQPEKHDYPDGVFPIAVNPKKRKKIGCLQIFLIVFSVLFILSLLTPSKSKTVSVASSSSADISADKPVEDFNSVSVSEEKETENKTPPTLTKDMPLGTAIESGEFSIALSYIKTANSVSTSLNTSTAASDGNEIIFVFFDVKNVGSKVSTFSKSSVSAYADSIKLESTPDYLLFVEDGIEELNSYTIDVDTYAMIPFEFEVEKGWNELKVYYNDFNWAIKAADVSSVSFDAVSLYNVSTDYNDTEIGYTTSTKKYDVTFEGAEIVPQKYSWSGPWIAFKYSIKNTSEETLDLSLVGYKMRCYRNRYLMDDASFTLNDSLNGFTNIYDVDDVKPGMTAQIYVAFETDATDGNYMMTFDDGYIFGNIVDYFYIGM